MAEILLGLKTLNVGYLGAGSLMTDVHSGYLS